MAKVDFTGVGDNFEPIPAGTYDAVFTSYKNHTSKNDAPYVSLEFTVNDSEYAGRKAWQNHSFQPQTLWALKRTAKALGAGDEELTGEMDTDDLLNGLIGNDCRLDLEVREYQGRFNNGIAAIKAVGLD